MLPPPSSIDFNTISTTLNSSDCWIWIFHLGVWGLVTRGSMRAWKSRWKTWYQLTTWRSTWQSLYVVDGNEQLVYLFGYVPAWAVSSGRVQRFYSSEISFEFSTIWVGPVGYIFTELHINCSVNHIAGSKREMGDVRSMICTSFCLSETYNEAPWHVLQKCEQLCSCYCSLKDDHVLFVSFA